MPPVSGMKKRPPAELCNAGGRKCSQPWEETPSEMLRGEVERVAARNRAKGRSTNR